MSGDYKGKFRDRLKRMKLIRSYKYKGIKEKDNRLVSSDTNEVIVKNSDVKVGIVKINKKYSIVDEKKEDEKVNIKSKVINGVGVGAAVAYGIGKNLVDDVNESKDNIIKKPIENKVDELKNDYKLNISDNEEENKEEKVPLKNKIISGASVGAAVAYGIGKSLVGKDACTSKEDVTFKKGNNINRGKIFKSKKDIIVVDGVDDKDIKNGDRKTYLAHQIIKKVKKEYEKKLNIIEEIDSEIFFLKDRLENTDDLEECKKIKEEIDKKIKEINHIIEQYNIYKSYNFLLDMNDIDDDSLVDNITEFKKLYNGADIKRRLSSDYELINKYADLYYNLDKISNKVDDLKEKYEEKYSNISDRDKRYGDIKVEEEKVEDCNKKCQIMIKDQNEYIKDISNKIGRINVEDVINYRFRGFGTMLESTIIYLSTMRSIKKIHGIGGVAMRNLAINNAINGLRSAFRVDKYMSKYYSCEDLQFELGSRINDIDFNLNSIDNTIDNIKGLKEDFMKFYKYGDKDFDEFLRKINNIESMAYSNKDKLINIQSRLKLSKKINKDTLIRVRRLEDEKKETRIG